MESALAKAYGNAQKWGQAFGVKLPNLPQQQPKIISPIPQSQMISPAKVNQPKPQAKVNPVVNAVKGYFAQVEANKKEPFFNNKGNNPIQWAGKVVEDFKKRGPFEAAQDLTYPVLMNPYIEPIEEPIVGAIRVANYKAGRPNWLVNNLLGQTDKQMAPQPLPNAYGKPSPTPIPLGRGNMQPKPMVKGASTSNIPAVEVIKANLDRGFKKYGSPPIATASAELAQLGHEIAQRGGNPYLPAALTIKETGGLKYKPAQAKNNPVGIGPGIQYPDLKVAILGGGTGGVNGAPQKGLKGVLEQPTYDEYYKTGNLQDFFKHYTPEGDPRNPSYQKQIQLTNELLQMFECI